MTESIQLDKASNEELAERIRELMAQMTPLEEELARLRVKVQQVATEQRRRERAQHLKSRQQVRTTVAEGQMPSLQQVAESESELVPSDRPLIAFLFFRDSGTEVGLGYATAREPTIWMTNGSSTVAVKTIADLRARYLGGWDFGTSAHQGVRIHIPGTRTEKLLQSSEIFLRAR